MLTQHSFSPSFHPFYPISPTTSFTFFLFLPSNRSNKINSTLSPTQDSTQCPIFSPFPPCRLQGHLKGKSSIGRGERGINENESYNSPSRHFVPLEFDWAKQRGTLKSEKGTAASPSLSLLYRHFLNLTPWEGDIKARRGK